MKSVPDHEFDSFLVRAVFKISHSINMFKITLFSACFLHSKSFFLTTHKSETIFFLKMTKYLLQFNHKHVLSLHLNAKDVIQTVKKRGKVV